MSASLAHEIKNPLASIRGTAEILMDDFPQGHPKREFLDIMMAEISRLNTSVQDILHYSRAGRTQDRTAPEPASAVIRRVSSLLEGRFREKAIRLTVSRETEPDFIAADGPKLSQVLMNLLLNALEATPEGGFVTVEYGTGSDGGGFIRVCDSGPGVRPQDAETIFKPFVTFRKEGTGLGLYISKTLMEGMGGGIGVGEASQGGACFTLTLPEPTRTPEETPGNAEPDPAHR
jgi:signal transduction histidine kinase